MKVTLENGDLVIRIPANLSPAPSSTGKTLSVASSHGNIETSVQVKGQNVRVGVNAYIYANPR